MKKYLLALLIVVFVASTITSAQPITPLYSDEEFLEALFWMYEDDYTRYSTPENYRPFDTLSRQEGAHVLSTYSSKAVGTVIDLTRSCEFTDIDQADPTLINSILISCLLGIFQGYDGAFRPSVHMTKAEFLTVLVRSIDGQRDETGFPRRQDYYKTAYQRGLTRQTDQSAIDTPLSRYETALLLYRAAQFLESETYRILQQSVDSTPTNDDDA